MMDETAIREKIKLEIEDMMGRAEDEFQKGINVGLQWAISRINGDM
jgi:hypothetical protein